MHAQFSLHFAIRKRSDTILCGTARGFERAIETPQLRRGAIYSVSQNSFRDRADQGKRGVLSRSDRMIRNRGWNPRIKAIPKMTSRSDV